MRPSPLWIAAAAAGAAVLAAATGLLKAIKRGAIKRDIRMSDCSQERWRAPPGGS